MLCRIKAENERSMFTISTVPPKASRCFTPGYALPCDDNIHNLITVTFGICIDSVTITEYN